MGAFYLFFFLIPNFTILLLLKYLKRVDGLFFGYEIGVENVIKKKKKHFSTDYLFLYLSIR